MSLTQDDIDGLRASIQQQSIITSQQINNLLALIIMLNSRDNVEWNIGKCGSLIDQVILLIRSSQNAGETAEEIDKLLGLLAQPAAAQQITSTVLKVEMYRRAFLFLLGLGVSYTLLEQIFPGITSAAGNVAISTANVCLQFAGQLYNLIISGGMSSQPITPANTIEIAAGAISNPPFSVGLFADAIGNAATTSVNGTADAVTQSFFSCGRIAAFCLQHVADAAKYAACKAAQLTSELLSLNTLTYAAQAIAFHVAVQGAKSAFEIAMGKYDEEIANYIDKRMLKDIISLISGLNRKITKLINDLRSDLKGAVVQSIVDMQKVTADFNNVDPSWVQNRYISRSVNDIINDFLRTSVLAASRGYRITLGTLISDLSAQPISAFDDDYVQNTLMPKYNIPKDPSSQQYINFRALITLWILATEKPDIYRQHSVPRPGAKYDTKGKSKVFKVPHEEKPSFVRSISLTPNLEKSLNKSQRRKLASINSDSKPVMTRIKKVTFPADLIKAIERNEITMDYIIEKGLNEPLGMLSEEHRAQIISEFDNAKLRHYSEEEPTAGNYKNKEYNMNLVLKDVATLLRNLGYDVSKAVNRHVGGRKSMRHKKRPKRSTIRRKKGRRVGQKSLKGKKRRYTKKTR